ncbi:MAG: exodeoxyribonuclease VII large subunit [Methylobacter sp.]|nr:exodeoxyribonuclease VII large subunit [Methylobacter sp.]MDP2098045.1 exodeoxyribonuclease VII large subunit [Methylobacter sp.]MDP2426662.1 exodeoxyribonuclease VII large subunit [Methylobacter sp.]MDP3053124.1 exodeoxyribonuclease VII large subunit [Methylobacter sp.]MDP3362346.1 exodeoxyribonuclease VII large subunit [Methylobacter sp.]
MITAPTAQRNIITVTQLNRATSQLLAEHFFSVLVEGELSNMAQPSSGHIYFTLKDANAQVRCAMFHTQQHRLGFKPENGKRVVVKAQVSLYEPRGDYQLIVEQIEEAGDGALRRDFDALKLKLSGQGLFDATHKQSLPVLPNAVGVITSPSGAAIRDILAVLRRRFAAIPVIIYPVAVQGDNAKHDIARAIATANRLKQCEVIILGRGGGSLEDLWAFNEELVARAIYASEIPIISAVGHETDVTIADFVADLRAATPSAAAEHASPDQQYWLSRFQALELRLQQHLQRKLNQKQQALDWLSQRLQQQHPGQKLARNAHRLNELENRLKHAMRGGLRQRAGMVEAKSAALWQYNPALTISSHQQRQDYLRQRLIAAMAHKLEQCKQRLLNSGQTLQAVSPLATLNRGYALVIRPDSGAVIRSGGQLKPGDKVQTRLAHGSFTSEVKAISRD